LKDFAVAEVHNTCEWKTYILFLQVLLSTDFLTVVVTIWSSAPQLYKPIRLCLAIDRTSKSILIFHRHP